MALATLHACEAIWSLLKFFFGKLEWKTSATLLLLSINHQTPALDPWKFPHPISQVVLFS
jgi:hypothetical protein